MINEHDINIKVGMISRENYRSFKLFHSHGSFLLLKQNLVAFNEASKINYIRKLADSLMSFERTIGF